MAEITDPTAVRFCNEIARKYADFLFAAILQGEQFRDVWISQNIPSVIPNTTDPIIDIVTLDGGRPITGNQVHGLKIGVEDLLTWAAVGNPNRKKRVGQIASRSYPRGLTVE